MADITMIEVQAVFGATCEVPGCTYQPTQFVSGHKLCGEHAAGFIAHLSVRHS